jgi:RNA polymerase sigma factor (sigma-70 family)
LAQNLHIPNKISIECGAGDPRAFAFLMAKNAKGAEMKTDTMNFVVGSFPDGYQARSATEDLLRSGFREDHFAVIAAEQEGRLTDEVLAVLEGMGLSHSQTAYCQEASAAGQTLVVVKALARSRAAQLVLQRNGSPRAYFAKPYLEDAGPHLVGWPFSSDKEDVMDNHVRNERVMENRKLVYKMASVLSKRGIINRLDLDDAHQEGMLALTRASDTFNPAMGAFSTYACRSICRQLRIANRRASFIKIPDSYRPDKPYYVHEKQLKSISTDHPTIAKRMAYEPVPYEEPQDYTALYDCINQLTPRLASIIRQRLKGNSLQAIADPLGLTRERVRQLVEEGLKSLKKCLCFGMAAELAAKTGLWRPLNYGRRDPKSDAQERH